MNEKKFEYLLIGGYAVVYYGYPRTTGDIDIWIGQDAPNVTRVVEAPHAFGFGSEEVSTEDFLTDKVHRMGIAPLRIEMLTTISGVDFAECWDKRRMAVIDNIPITFIDLDSLKANKTASGRLKDLNDLQHLP